MRLPENVVSSGRAAVEALWEDTATVIREIDVDQSSEPRTVYDGIICHLSQTSAPALDTSQAAARTEPEFTLFVGTDIILKEGDAVTVQHRGQTFKSLAGLPFHRTFCNAVKLSGVEIA